MSIPNWWKKPEAAWEHRLIDVIIDLNTVRNGGRARLWARPISVDRILQVIIAICTSWLKMREWKRK